ncbi:carboxymuconolactone decarboxylase family protein [Sulfurimonas sp.]
MKTNTQRLKEIKELIGKLQKDVPVQIGAFNKFMMAAETSTVIDKKNLELINLALGIAAQCEWCIALHVKNAIDAGATKEEILEAAMQAVLMHGGPALMYMIPVENAIEEFIN